MIHKILVATDFSPDADEALAWAADLGRRFGARVTVTHVMEPLAPGLPAGYTVADLPERSVIAGQLRRHLDRTARAMQAEQGLEEVDSELLSGSPYAEIVDLARAGDFDLVVVGTHGRTGIKRILMGSVAERVMRHAPCPVLIVGRGGRASSHLAEGLQRTGA